MPPRRLRYVLLPDLLDIAYPFLVATAPRVVTTLIEAASSLAPGPTRVQWLAAESDCVNVLVSVLTRLERW